MNGIRTTLAVAVCAALTGPLAAQDRPRAGEPMHGGTMQRDTMRQGEPMRQGDAMPRGAGPAVRPDAGPTSATVSPAIGETMIYRGTVRAVDAGSRTVVVEGDGGGTSTLRIGNGVRNFDNLRTGDRVTVRYTEAVAHSIVENPDSPGIRERIEADAATQTPPGGRPGMRAIERVTLVATVVDVDEAGGRVTLRGTGREPIRLRVPDRSMLDRLDRGDQVVATYAQSAAVSIEPGGGPARMR